MAEGTGAATVVLARCCRTEEHFGVRFEERARGAWFATWAFGMKPAVASREHFDRSTISGSFNTDDDYPGCPSCGAPSFVRCGACGQMGCWRSPTRYRCPWCSDEGTVEGYITELSSSDDH